MTEKIEILKMQLNQAYNNLIKKASELKIETENYVNNELKKINHN